ncbi:Protein nud1, partial [Cryomyces antarcticus]
LSSVSPKKRKDTPEWRRRIIKGQVGYGDQTDLFGPSGLENIFQQPARPQPPRPHSEAPPGLAHFGNGNNLPSSPPPWPSEVQLSSPGGTVQAFKTNLNHLKEEEAVVKSLGSLDSESDREEMQVSTSTDVHGAARKPPLKYREPTVELPSIMEWSSLQDESDKVCSPPGVPGAVQNRSPVKAFVEDSQSQTIGSRVASGQTELRNEEFSPVYISKHNSTNGQVDYAPLDASSAQVTEQLKRL